MLEAKHILQQRYQLKQKLAQNAGSSDLVSRRYLNSASRSSNPQIFGIWRTVSMARFKAF